MVYREQLTNILDEQLEIISFVQDPEGTTYICWPDGTEERYSTYEKACKAAYKAGFID